jgi:hypothetical protein
MFLTGRDTLNVMPALVAGIPIRDAPCPPLGITGT